MAEKPIYKVIFFSQGEIYEVYAKKVSQGGLFGFVEVEDLVFGTTTKLVVDPSQERLAREFDGVHRTYIPIHAVLRIDEVDKEGAGRITSLPKDAEGKIRPFPTPIYTPRKDGEKT
jgi:hypothetical protein